MTANNHDHLGPIDLFVVGFPDGKPTPGGFAKLLELVDARHIHVLDVEFVTRMNGEVATFEPSDVPDVIAEFAGASSGLLDATDLSTLDAELKDGMVAAVVVYEELSIVEAFDTWEDEGAQILLEGHLTPEELSDALDATETR